MLLSARIFIPEGSIPIGAEYAFAVGSRVGVAPKAITLRLYQIRWESAATIGVEVCEASSEARRYHTTLHG